MSNSLAIVKSSKLVPTMKESLIKILKMNTSTNKFVITDEQLKEFSKLVVNSSYFKNFSNWYKFFSQTGLKNLPILFSPFQRNHLSIYDDQIARSKTIVDYMKSNPKSELITMDGHGRLIYSIISQFQQDKSFIKSKRKIHLVDIDKTTNDFHQQMFPQKIFRKTINVPEAQDILEINNSFLENNKISDPFLYLNFCGIGCCANESKKGNERVIDFIKKWLESNKKIMLSLSLRPYGFKTHYQGKITTYGMLQNFNNLQLISRRSNFVTYMISN